MSPLWFLYPAFLTGAVAAAVPVLLHLLKKETAPPFLFSAVRFLKRAPEERTRRQKLREIVLLALRVAAIVLLAAAFARPYWLRGAGPDEVTIVAVDTSFSLSSPGRFERAKALAREAIDRAGAGHLTGVVAFGDEAAVVAEPSADRAAARAAFDRLEPGFGGTRYRVALDRAAAAVGPRPGRVVVVTDLQRTGWRADADVALPPGVAVQVIDVGGLPSNLAVTALSVERGRATALVRNGGAGSRSTRVHLTIDGRSAGDVPRQLEPGALAEVTFDTDLPATGVARVFLDDPTGYAADDSRVLVLDPPAPAPILVVTPTGHLASDAFFVGQAFEAGHEASRFRLEATSGPALPASAGALAGYAGVMLLATRGVDRRAADALAAYVAGGGGLLLAASDDTDAGVAARLLGSAVALGPAATPRDVAPFSLAPIDARHPIIRAFGPLAVNLGQVRFTRALALDESAWQPIARFSDGTLALGERRVGRGRMLVFASDLDGRWSDFPRQPTFVPFLHETMRYVTGDRRDPTSYLVGDAPPGVERRPGVATVGNPPRRVAVNVDPRESDPARQTEQEFLGAIRQRDPSSGTARPALGRQAEAGQGYWRYALALVLVTLVIEGVVGRRLS